LPLACPLFSGFLELVADRRNRVIARKKATRDRGRPATSAAVGDDIPPDIDALADLLVQEEQEEQEIAAEAAERFPGPDPADECLRAAYVAIVAARVPSASAAEILGQLRNIVRSDPEELSDSLDGGGTVIEMDLAEILTLLNEAARACQHAAAMLRRTRRRRPEALRMVSLGCVTNAK
jgi:uncharacterized protein YqgV (UPF0045/DUF77 family)